MKYKNLMAKALYDNVPESPEELAFRKGDILTIMEQNTGGLEGWWLCSLHGRQGIAPGNRLKLLIGAMFDAQSPVAQSSPTGSAYQQKAVSSSQGLYQSPGQQGIYQVPTGQDVYQVPPQRNALAADNTTSKVVTPTGVGQSYAYSAGQHNQQDLYDVPPMRPQGVYDIPPGKLMGSHSPGQHGNAHPQEGVYDIPPGKLMGSPYPGQHGNARPQVGVHDIPPSTQMDPRTQGV